jgi:lipoprotein-releasing system ATP-binding protein
MFVFLLIANKSKHETEIEAKKIIGLSWAFPQSESQTQWTIWGEQQRVAVARALINKPAIIFADEPSGNFDTASAENLHQLFFK